MEHVTLADSPGHNHHLPLGLTISLYAWPNSQLMLSLADYA